MKRNWMIFIIMLCLCVLGSVLGERNKPEREIFAYQGDVAWFLENEKFGLINQDEEVLYPAELERVEPFQDGVACVRFEGKYGLLNNQGQWNFLPACTKRIRFYGEEYTVVNKGDVYTQYLINKKGEEFYTFDNRFANVGEYSDGLLRKMTKIEENPDNYILEYVTIDGKKAFDFNWNSESPFSEGLAAVEEDDKWGFMNKKGELVIPFKYEFDDYYIPWFEEGLALINRGGWYEYINGKGEVVIEGKWDDARNFGKHGLAPVMITGIKEYGNEPEWGYINRQGEMVLKPYWQHASAFSENGLAAVQDTGGAGASYGYINTKGEYVFEPQWNSAHSFEGDYACVGFNPEIYINIKGEVVCRELED